MFKNRSIKLTFVKDTPVADVSTQPDIVEIAEEIDLIAREFTIDLAKLTVGAAAALMTLRTALEIVQHHATK